jgi:IQ calmodulin-binding motif
MKWSRPRSARLRMMSRRSVAVKSEYHLMRKALLFPAQKTHEIVKTVTKVGGTQLETAIKTLSSAFATPRSNKSFENDIGRSQHVRRGSNSSIVSDITLPSTFDFTSSDIVTSAEEIVMNARRKQAVLIGILIKLQSQCRVQRARQLVLDRKCQGANKEQKLISPSIFETRRLVRAVVRMQTWLRRSRLRRDFVRRRYAAVCLQKRVRGNRIRMGYVIFVGIFTRFQAIIRGHSVRKALRSLIKDRMTIYRSQMFALWKETFTPLSYRTKYWTAIKGDRILSLVLAELELNRIWGVLKLSTPIDSVPTNTFPAMLSFSNPLGTVDVSFRKAIKVS